MTRVRFARTWLAALVIASGLALVHRYGGGAERARVPGGPNGESTENAERDGGGREGKGAPAKAAGGEAYEAKIRFVSALGAARIDAPNSRAGMALLKPYWRRMRVPFVSLSGDAGRLAMSIALRTSPHESAWSTAMPGGSTWAPDAHVWNMNEGSFDQRESIFAPSPATLSYRVSVPPHAALTFSAAMVNRATEDGLFTVTVVDAAGTEREVCSKRVSAYQASAWHDMRCPMDEWGGHDVELRLKTTAIARDPHAPKPPPVPAKKPGAAASSTHAPSEWGLEGTASGSRDLVDEPLATNIPLLLWGHPTLLAKEPSKVPYNVVWIVIDALRPDVLASFHDDAEDAKKRAAPHPPLEALLPKIDGLTPAIDDLAHQGTRFTHAYSAATWTRPGTLAMLAGARSTELGVESLHFVLHDADIDRYYGSDPPLISRILGKNGVSNRAFVNNFFMAGYAAAGLDMGFERVSDHRYHTRDTAEITRDAVSFIQQNAQDRFFLFCNYNSPHAPWEPPERLLDKVPPPPSGPSDKHVRRYMAEAAKDDEAVGELVRALDAAHLRERTLIVVMADHGETLSSAHDGTSLLDDLPVRFHHAAGNYEETSRIPILAVLPGVLPANAVVSERVRSIDVAPTVLELEGLEPPTRMSGRSMLSLVRGGAKEDERVVLTQGRSTRALIVGQYRLLVREGNAQTTRYGDRSVTAPEELFDLEDDPGERKNVASLHPDVVAEMRARLAAAEQNVAVVGAEHGGEKEHRENESPIHLRFAGAGAVHRVSGTLRALAEGAAFRVEPSGVAREMLKVEPGRVEFGFATVPEGVVGFDLRVEPSDAKIAWELYLDDQPWPADRFFAGPLGLWEASLEHGIATDEARSAIASRAIPEIDFARDLGLFVTNSSEESTAEEARRFGAGAEEMSRMLRAWGYAHGSGSATGAK